MKEITFRNRIPVYPGRVIMTPVAGQANTYDMVRADEPTEEGTPLNKTAFDSIIQSRLTGRYYTPTLSRNVYSTQTGLTSSPIPTSGWVEDASTTEIATNGIYTVTVSSDQSAYGYGYEAFSSSGWQSVGGLVSWIQLYTPQAIKVRSMQFTVELQYTSRFAWMEIQGSNDGSAWAALLYSSSIDEGAVTYSFAYPGEYQYYRLYFTSNDSNRITVSSWTYTLYDINTYTNAFTVTDNFPTTWTTGQRVMLATPTTINSFAVVANTLNGVTVNTILQPNKRYELRYTGSAFAVKEV